MSFFAKDCFFNFLSISEGLDPMSKLDVGITVNFVRVVFKLFSNLRSATIESVVSLPQSLRAMIVSRGGVLNAALC